MTDIVDSKTRSRMMSGIRGKNTKPELIIRKELHKKGFRYKIHDDKLPGKPDIVLPKYNSIIFINGCFWHGHMCHLFKYPNTRKEFWFMKINNTKEKDLENINALLKAKWRVLLIWECAYKGTRKLPIDKLIEKISKWINSDTNYLEIEGVD